MSVADNFLVQNQYVTPDGTVLNSRHRHDYVSYQDKNGKTYMVDGGILNYYSRVSTNIDDCENKCVYYSHGHEACRDVVKWGTFGKKGDEHFKLVLLKDMSTGHIEAILEDGIGSKEYRLLFKDELEYRNC